MQDHLSFLISHTAVVRNRGILTTDGQAIPRIRTVLICGMVSALPKEADSGAELSMGCVYSAVLPGHAEVVDEVF